MTHFVFFRGVLCWGVPCFVGTTFLFQDPPEFLQGVAAFLIWALGGYVFGHIFWKKNEEVYHQERGRRSVAKHEIPSQ